MLLEKRFPLLFLKIILGGKAWQKYIYKYILGENERESDIYIYIYIYIERERERERKKRE